MIEGVMQGAIIYREEVEMRGLSLLLLGAVLAVPSAAAQEQQQVLSPKAQEKFNRVTAGMVAKAPVPCMSTFNAYQTTVIDDQTVAFRFGSNRLYVAHLPGGCSNLATPPYTMVTRQVGSAQICRGDIANIVDPHNGFTVGSCIFGDFTPYTKANQ
jgi:hypothetical protein